MPSSSAASPPPMNRRLALPQLAGQAGMRLIHRNRTAAGHHCRPLATPWCLQLTAAGPDKWRKAIVPLAKTTGRWGHRIYERSDSDVRRLEGAGTGHRLGVRRSAAGGR